VGVKEIFQAEMEGSNEKGCQTAPYSNGFRAVMLSEAKHLAVPKTPDPSLRSE